MAKKSKKAAGVSAAVLSDKDKRTLKSIRELAGVVVDFADRGRSPYTDIPSRSLSNVRFNASKRFIEMGSGTNRRELFNLTQAKAYMQTLLVGSGCKELVDQGKTLSIRGLYYRLKHRIKPTLENTFEDQSECDPIIEDVEVLLNALREELHLYADKRGEMVGNITIVDKGDEIDCSRMGSGGYGIPSICEPEIIELDPRRCKADFVLHVEKGTVWQRFNEDKFWQEHNCILTHGAGQPPRGVRRMLHRLLDNDPWGYYIYSVIKQGSINLAFESKRMAVPGAKYLGLRSEDYERCGLAEDVTIALTDQDKKRASQIASYPWFEKNKRWQREIEALLKNNFKLEVESLISKDISYVTEVYVPERLEEGEFLD
jgi:DNA topoisomerase VI subunit A